MSSILRVSATNEQDTDPLTTSAEVLYSRPIDLDIFDPPYYPRIITVYCHARFRMPELSADEARASDVQQWDKPEDYARWEDKLRTSKTDAWPEDPGSGVPEGWPRDSAREVSDRGLRTGHVLLRPGYAPKAGWSSLKMFGDRGQSPHKLSDTQSQTSEQFMLMRSLDLVFNTFDKMTREERRLVERIVFYGLPDRALNNPPTRGDGDRYHRVCLGWQDEMGWDLEVRPCPPNRNPAAYISGCYNAPLIISHNRGNGYRYSQVTLGQADNRVQERLLTDFADAVRNKQHAKMGELYTLLLGQVINAEAESNQAVPATQGAELPSTGVILPPGIGTESPRGSRRR